MFPLSSGDFETLAAAVERLTLNDASVTVGRETSNALGAGFRCGCAPKLLTTSDGVHALRAALPVTNLRFDHCCHVKGCRHMCCARYLLSRLRKRVIP